MNEVFIPKTSFIAYLLLVYDKCRLVVKKSYFPCMPCRMTGVFSVCLRQINVSWWIILIIFGYVQTLKFLNVEDGRSECRASDITRREWCRCMLFERSACFLVFSSYFSCRKMSGSAAVQQLNILPSLGRLVQLVRTLHSHCSIFSLIRQLYLGFILAF